MIHSKQRQQIVALVITLLPLVIGALTPVLGVLVATEIDDTAPGTLRAIRVAVFDLDVGRDVDVESGALTDLVNVMIQTIPEVTVVNRTEMDTTAKEKRHCLCEDVLRLPKNVVLVHETSLILVPFAQIVGISLFFCFGVCATTEERVDAVQNLAGSESLSLG